MYVVYAAIRRRVVQDMPCITSGIWGGGGGGGVHARVARVAPSVVIADCGPAGLKDRPDQSDRTQRPAIAQIARPPLRPDLALGHWLIEEAHCPLTTAVQAEE